MNSYLSRALLIATAAFGLLSEESLAAVGDVYNLKTDFSTTSNPNTTALGGTWSFHNNSDESLLLPTANPIGFVSSPGYDPGGGTPAIWNGFTDLITSVPFDPDVVGTHGDLLVRWTSPENGFVRVEGYYFQDNRNPPPKRIMGYLLEKNGGLLDSQEVPSGSSPVYFDEMVAIAVGDKIDLRLVGNFPGATQPFADFGGLVASISVVVPEPTSIGMLTIGLCMALVVGKRHRR